MRIISGTHKGRRLKIPKNLPVRPTTDMAKEALFNILMHRYNFQELSVLDLFSGTGNIAYEFCSRGTPSVLAIDREFRCTKFIEKTASQFEMPIDVRKSDVFSFLEHKNTENTVIFAKSILIGVPVSYLFFLPFFFAKNLNMNFWLIYLIGIALLVIGYFVHKYIMSLI